MITVLIGGQVHHGTHVSGKFQDAEFEGEELGRDSSSDPGGSRGTVHTLYRSADGRLLVHTKDWSHWQGEGTYYSLRVIQESDLQIGGEYEELGIECGFGRSLTLDEALARTQD